MDLVVDANVVIAALISQKGHTADLFCSDSLCLSAPEFLIDEIRKHTLEIVEKPQMARKDFEMLLTLVTSRIILLPTNEFDDFQQKAESICPDPDDVEYFAVALKVNCPLWSNDQKLKLQDTVKVISTTELIQLFDLESGGHI